MDYVLTKLKKNFKNVDQSQKDRIQLSINFKIVLEILSISGTNKSANC